MLEYIDSLFIYTFITKVQQKYHKALNSSMVIFGPLPA